MITGGADGKLVVWRDATDEIYEAEMEKRDEIILKLIILLSTEKFNKNDDDGLFVCFS